MSPLILTFRISDKIVLNTSRLRHAYYMPRPSHPLYLITVILFGDEYTGYECPH
jgi:hypothetical protein